MMWFHILKTLREKSGESMAAAAEMLQIAKSTYASYEYGKREPNIDTLKKIANHYNVSVDYLLGQEPAPNPFTDLNLSEDDEAEVIAKYMSLPSEIRACMLDVLIQLGNAAQKSTLKQHQTTVISSNNTPPQQKTQNKVKLVPYAARGGARPGFIETTEEEEAILLAAPDEDWDL